MYHTSDRRRTMARPWLGSKKEYNDPVSCTAQLRVLQRGASNVYFSMTASALTIPPWSSKVQQEIAVRWEQIEDILASNPGEYVLRAVVQSVFHSLLEMQICTIDELISEIKKRYNDGNGGEYTKQNLLEDEYRVFCMGDYDDPEDVQFRIVRATVPEFLEDYIEDIVLAKRLREVLALRGFRRITGHVSPRQLDKRLPDDWADPFTDEHHDGGLFAP